MGEYYKDGYDRLASAIVAQGGWDFYEAGKDAIKQIDRFLKNKSKKKNKEILRSFDKDYCTMAECRQFFFSGWFATISDLDGPTLYKDILRRLSEHAGERNAQ